MIRLFACKRRCTVCIAAWHVSMAEDCGMLSLLAQRLQARVAMKAGKQLAAVIRALTWWLDALRWTVDDVEEQVMEAVARVARPGHEGVLE